MKKFFDKFSIQLKLLLISTIELVVVAVLFYFLIPIILNYPAGTFGTAFQEELENTNYTLQVASISALIFVFYIALIFSKTSFLVNINHVLRNIKDYDAAFINNLKQKLYKAPYSIYLLNITITSIIITIIHAFTINTIGIINFKIFILLFSFITVVAMIALFYSQKLFTDIILKLPSLEYDHKKNSLRTRVFLYFLPLLMTSILFTILLGYTRLIVEKGNILFETYNDRLKHYIEMEDPKRETDLFQLISEAVVINDGDYYFVKAPNGTYYNKDKEVIELSAFFQKYSAEFSPSQDGRVYEYYGTDSGGAIQSITINGEEYVVGVYYSVSSYEILLYFLMSFFVLILLNIGVLVLFSKNISDNIKRISSSMFKISEASNVDMQTKLIDTSNDEIGELISGFNKIQDMTFKHLNQIQDNQNMIMEKERLASLGQLVGRNCT